MFRSVSPVEAYVSEVPYNLSESTEKYLLEVFFIRGTWDQMAIRPFQTAVVLRIMADIAGNQTPFVKPVVSHSNDGIIPALIHLLKCY